VTEKALKLELLKEKEEKNDAIRKNLMALKQGILSRVRENNETKLGINENVTPRQNKSLFL